MHGKVATAFLFLAAVLTAKEPVSREFPYPIDKVWTAAVQAAAENNTILVSDKDSHVLTFKTDRTRMTKFGYTVTAIVKPTESGSQISLNLKYANGGGLSLDPKFGAEKKQANNYLDRVEGALKQ